jgi:hypothetical protein
MARVEFTPRRSNLTCGLVAVGTFTVLWMTAAVFARSLIVAAVGLVPAALLGYLWREQWLWGRRGPPLVVVDSEGLWEDRRDEIALKVRWSELALWTFVSGENAAWTFETTSAKYTVNEGSIESREKENFERAVERASGKICSK